MAARDLGLTSGSGDDEGERLEPWDLAALGGGEADAERFVRDFVLRTGEADSTCADFRLLGLKKATRYITLCKTNGRPMRCYNFPNILFLKLSLLLNKLS